MRGTSGALGHIFQIMPFGGRKEDLGGHSAAKAMEFFLYFLDQTRQRCVYSVSLGVVLPC